MDGWILIAANHDMGLIVAHSDEPHVADLCSLSSGYSDEIVFSEPPGPGLWLFVPTSFVMRSAHGQPPTGGPDDIAYLKGEWRKAADWYLLASDIVPTVLSRVLNQRKGDEG